MRQDGLKICTCHKELKRTAKPFLYSFVSSRLKAIPSFSHFELYYRYATDLTARCAFYFETPGNGMPPVAIEQTLEQRDSAHADKQ